MQGALWVITDRRPIPSDASSAASLCQMARQGCSGIYADFERPPGNAACRFLAALQAGLAASSSAARSSRLRAAAAGGGLRATWQPGDGAFSAAVQAACGRRAGRACFLDLAPVCCRVRLGKSAPPERLSPAALAEALTGPVFYNAPLGCYYRLTHTGDALLCTLFRHRRVFSSAPQPRAPAPNRPLASAARIGRALQCPPILKFLPFQHKNPLIIWLNSDKELNHLSTVS